VRIAYYNRLLNEPWGCGVHGRALVEAWRRAGHEVVCLPEALAEEGAIERQSRLNRFRWIPEWVRIPAMQIRGWTRLARSGWRTAEALRAFRPDVLVARRAAYDFLLDYVERRHDRPRLIAEVNALLYWEVRTVERQHVPQSEENREKRFLHGSDHCVAVSEATASQLAEIGIPADAVTVIPNGADVAEFGPGVEPDHLVAEWARGHSGVVVYCGTLAAHHDMPTMAGAFRSLARQPSLGFLFIGPTSEELAGVLGSRVLDDSRVWCTGRVPHAEVASLLACSTAAWIALANDGGSPLKVLEYMAMGLPVALAGERQARDLLEQAGGGLCVARQDAQGLAAAVSALLADQAAAAKMGAAGRAWVECNASWDGVAARMLECLNREGET